ncbi:MAG: MFS transporter [Chloroflexi bacterium]|nr:MFS transporter [Chloroflexota bacterium]
MAMTTRLALASRQANRQAARKTLRLGFWEGTTGFTALSIAESFFSPLAIALKGTAFQIGLLVGVPYLAAALAQLFTHRLVAWLRSRKRVMLWSVGLSVLPWLGIAWLPHVGLPDPVAWLIPLAAGVMVLQNLSAPAWGSWIADLLPMRRRGDYLGLRMAAAGVVASAAVLAFGVLLDRLDSRVYWGFSAVFVLAVVLRLGSLALLSGMHEPMVRGGPNGPGLWTFLGSLGRTRLGHLVLYMGLLYFGTNVAGPYFAVYMLRDLGVGYATFMFLNAANVVAAIVGVRFWGLYADRYGNRAVLRITGVAISFLPLLWLFSQWVPYLVAINAAGGFVWGGLTLCALNFVYELAPSAARTRAVGHFNASIGAGVFLGGLAGGIIAGRVPLLFEHRLMTLFLLSGVLRLLVTVVFVPTIRGTQAPGGRPSWPLPFHHFGKHS